MVQKSLLFFVLLSFIACNNSLSNKEKDEYLQKGKEITQATFKELSSNLMSQMKEGGPAKAIPFCNVQAMPITNEMAIKFNAEIKRTSDKIRNVNNKASLRELEIIQLFNKLATLKKELKPIIELDKNGNKHFYAPIVINAKCLSCHGNLNKELSEKTNLLVKSLYTNDDAIGYNEGDLRGIWSVTFNK